MPEGNTGVQETEHGHFIWCRRDLLSLAGWGAVLTCFAAAGGAILRLLFPRVLFEPPTAFKAGHPDDYTVGEVSEKWMKTERVWIIRTHLGCRTFALRGLSQDRFPQRAQAPRSLQRSPGFNQTPNSDDDSSSRLSRSLAGNITLPVEITLVLRSRGGLPERSQMVT